MPPAWVKLFTSAQLYLPGFRDLELKNSAQVACVVGSFYEILGATMLSAYREENPPKTWEVYPDLVYWGDKYGMDNDILVEVKGSGRAYGLYLSWFQIERYKELQKTEFPFTAPRIYYLIFVHGLKSMAKTYDTQLELIEALACNTLGALLMPLDLILETQYWMNLRESSFWHSPAHRHPGSPRGRGWDKDLLLRFTGPRLHRWAIGQERVDSYFFGESGGDYTMNGFESRIDRVPSFQILDFRTNSFLFTQILEKDQGG
jgi:hypothetical protein